MIRDCEERISQIQADLDQGTLQAVDLTWLLGLVARLRADLSEAHAALGERLSEGEQMVLSMQECGSDIHQSLLAELYDTDAEESSDSGH